VSSADDSNTNQHPKYILPKFLPLIYAIKTSQVLNAKETNVTTRNSVFIKQITTKNIADQQFAFKLYIFKSTIPAKSLKHYSLSHMGRSNPAVALCTAEIWHGSMFSTSGLTKSFSLAFLPFR
jgi:hypothetical protein